MLEASNYNQFDSVSPFWKKLLMPVAEMHLRLLLLKYSHGTLILQTTFLIVSVVWARKIKKNLDLESEIDRFKEKQKSGFGSFKASCMAKSKWNALKHGVEALRQVGSVKCPDPGLFEETQKRSKTQYRHTSRKRGTATKETREDF